MKCLCTALLITLIAHLEIIIALLAPVIQCISQTTQRGTALDIYIKGYVSQKAKVIWEKMLNTDKNQKVSNVLILIH